MPRFSAKILGALLNVQDGHQISIFSSTDQFPGKTVNISAHIARYQSMGDLWSTGLDRMDQGSVCMICK